MKTVRFTLLLLITYSTSVVLHAQTDFIWAVKAGGSGVDIGKLIESDGNGGLIVTGTFHETANFSGFSLSTSGSAYSDIFLARYDVKGNPVWVKSIGGINTEIVEGLDVDDKGCIYLSGCFSGSMSVGSFQLNSKGLTDMFVIKLKPDGTVIWAVSAGGTGQEQGGYLSLQGEALYLSGSFSGTFMSAKDTITSVGFSDAFLVKLDTAGNEEWLLRAGGKMNEYIKGVAASKNLVFISGQFQDTCYFGNIIVVGQKATDIFIAAYTSSGEILWANAANGEYGNYPNAMAADQNGNAYITGCFGKTIQFSTISLTATGIVDAFFACYDSSGTCKWAKRAGGSSYTQGLGIYADNNGVIATGFYNTSINFGSISFTNSNNHDIFFTELDHTGNYLWAKSAGGSNWDFGCDACRIGNHVYGTGYFDENAKFETITLNSPSANQEVFMCKIGTPPPPTIFITQQPSGADKCVGDSLKLNIAAIGKNMKYQWKFNSAAIPGASDSFYIISNLKSTDAGKYTCTISDSTYSVTSNEAVVKVGSKPLITKQPSAVTAKVKSSASFSIVATGTGLSYQWKKNGNNITGATNSSYNIGSVQFSDSGLYSCEVMNNCGSISSVAVILKVNPATGMDENEEKPLIYPNPASGWLYINLQNKGNDINMRMYATDGRLMLQGVLKNGENKIDLKGIPSGLYRILIFESESISMSVLIK